MSSPHVFYTVCAVLRQNDHIVVILHPLRSPQSDALILQIKKSIGITWHGLFTVSEETTKSGFFTSISVLFVGTLLVYPKKYTIDSELMLDCLCVQVFCLMCNFSSS